MSAEPQDLRDYKETLTNLIYRLAEQGLSVDDIQNHPDVLQYLPVVLPDERCKTGSYHRYIQDQIRRAKNPDGTRRFVSIYRQNPLFPAFSEEAREDARKNTFYATRELVERTPRLKVIALRALQKLVNGGIRNAGYIGGETREELVRLIGEVFDRIISPLKDTGS